MHNSGSRTQAATTLKPSHRVYYANSPQPGRTPLHEKPQPRRGEHSSTTGRNPSRRRIPFDTTEIAPQPREQVWHQRPSRRRLLLLSAVSLVFKVGGTFSRMCSVVRSLCSANKLSDISIADMPLGVDHDPTHSIPVRCLHTARVSPHHQTSLPSLSLPRHSVLPVVI